MTSRENLKKLSKSTLQKMCQDTGFDVKGKKKGDLVDLLFMSTLPPDQITPVLEQSSNLTGLMPQIHPESPLLPPFDKCNYSSIPYTELPTPSFVGIYHFMISRARESCQDRGVNNFKGMDRAVSHFESGDVQDIQVAMVHIDTSIIYIKAQCLASMKKDRYTVYLCLTNEDHDLKIHYAYCQCPIGLAQSCSHIGAVLLALNGKDRLKSDQDTPCTSQLCKWVVPRSSNPIPQPVTQMDFGKPKAEGPTKVSSSTFDPRHPDDRGHDSGYLFRQLKELKKCFPDTGIAHLWDIEDEVPEAVSEVIIDEDEGPSKEIERYIYSNGRVVPLTISTNLVKEIEMHTRGQRLSPLWHDLHKGRITSSSFGKVLRAGHSPNSIVRNIIEGSNLQKYNTLPPAVKWGQDHEEKARRQYVELMSLVKDVSVVDTGITLCESHSFIGASSDGRIFEGDEEGVLEIKCPFSMNGVEVHNMQIDDIISLGDKSFCLVEGVSGPQLRHDHEYFAQVQGEMSVMGLPWCDFVVWTNASSNNIFIERIMFDVDFVTEMMPKLVAFYVEKIFPNL
ncbi:hypothetical protein FSP39_020126 [Pinctada imbricata]|uniref:SWIM-type domain-containing protein n=1 Tax=Pinctada imbricata TaxID=66713 RepID=A0AA89BW83_PINIB|nr:hypothetical protein FSP39_020126 [Pinctada imbricata]